MEMLFNSSSLARDGSDIKLGVRYQLVSDNRKRDAFLASDDRLAKGWPIITLFECQFKARFHPSCSVSIDEAMIRFDGRLSWKQYMQKKPVKWWIKPWCLCDSATGYCVGLSVYTGAPNDDNNGIDLGYRIVMQLMCDYLSSNRCVFADNYFTSVHLAKDLLQAATYLCETTRPSRHDFSFSKTV